VRYAITCLTGVMLVAVAGCGAAPRTSAAGVAGTHEVAARSAAGGSARGHVVTRASVRGATAASGTCNPKDPEANGLAPQGPPDVTSGSFMATIRKRGYLIAGVDQSTYPFGYLSPFNGLPEGFDVDVIYAVAKAIFGSSFSPGKVEFKTISDAQRRPDVQHGSVDIVAHTMTILCSRLKEVDFSSVYFMAHQSVLVLSNSLATGLASLGGQKVCTSASSDSADLIASYPVHPRLVPVILPQITDCLVRLQQDQIAAIWTDDAILNGLKAQDPFTKLVGPNLSNEPYGLAISNKHPDFVRFVNAVLVQYIADGGWAKSYAKWIGPSVPAPPKPQYAS